MKHGRKYQQLLSDKEYKHEDGNTKEQQWKTDKKYEFKYCGISDE